jgi:ABC-type glycerol-3-phosphate transport system substrate-binding protein
MGAISRRALLGSAAALVAGSVLSACGRAHPGGGGPVTLILEGKGQRSLFAQMIPEFEARHSGIRVQWGLTSGTQSTAMRDQMLASVGPDVLWLQDPGPYFAGRLLLPLDRFVAAAPTAIADIPQVALDTMRQGGRLYGLPRSAATGAYMVNVELVNAAQAAMPADGYTAGDAADLWNRLTTAGRVALPLLVVKSTMPVNSSP